MIASSTLFATILQGNGYSLTKPRKAVFDSLNAHESMTMGELIKDVAKSCDRASVYRTIELFETLNIVQRVPVGWKYKLELSNIFRSHHHHAICTACEQIIEFNETPEIEAALDQLAGQLDFNITDHNLELQGVCSNCK